MRVSNGVSLASRAATSTRLSATQSTSVSSFVEVLVQGAGGVEETTDVAVTGFREQPAGYSVVVPVSAVPLAALFSDGLQHLGGGASFFLGCLRQVAVGEFRSGLFQEAVAGLSILLGGHLGSSC